MPKNKTKKDKRNKNILRVPRPLGITQRNYQIQLEPDEIKRELKERKLKEYVIQNYITNGNELNGESISIQQLCHFLNLEPIIGLRIYKDCLIRLSKVQDMANPDMACGLIFALSQMALKVHTKASKQSHILMAAQGDNYVPFLSSAVNQAIANEATTLKPIQEALKMMLPAQGSSPILPTSGTNSYITQDAAIELITTQKGTMLSNGLLLLEKAKELEGLPNINARTQTDLDKIGIKNNANEVEIPTELKEAQHTMLTEDYTILDDSDDFKM